MRRKSLLYVNLAVILFAVPGLFAKWLDIPAIGITFGRVFFSSLALFIFINVRKVNFKVNNRRHLAFLLIAGVVLAFHWWTFLGAIQISTVAIGTITFSAYPLFVTFLEPKIFHQRLSAKNIAVAILILVGVIITIPEFSAENLQVKGIVVGMIASLLYAVLTLFNKELTQHYDGSVVAFYEQATAAVVLIPFVVTAGIHPSVKQIGMLVFLGVFATALAHTVFISSLKNLSAQTAGVCSSMETVYAIIMAFLFLREMPNGHEIVGGAVIVLTVIFSQLEFGNKKEIMK